MERQDRQTGITLIEMMIALLLGLIVTGAIITIFITNVKSSAENIKMIQLNQELRSVMTFMSDELRRHGYSATADSGFMNALRFDDLSGDGMDDCVIYAYDDLGVVNASHAAPTLNRGFRWNTATANIDWSAGNTSNCNNGDWQPLTSDAVEISAFELDISHSASAAAATIYVWDIDIGIEGRRQLHPGVAVRQFRETVRIRNDAGI